MQKTTKEEREKLYFQVLRDLRPLEKKYSKGILRWALNKWTIAEGKKNSLLRQKREIEKELTTL